MSDGMLLPGDLDAALCNMIRDAIMTIHEWIDAEGGGHQGSYTLDDIDWDNPAALAMPALSAAIDGRAERVNKATHAIGFICGVAAGLNVTPLTLIESYEDRKTTKAALAYYAGVRDPSFHEQASRAYRMYCRMDEEDQKAGVKRGIVTVTVPKTDTSQRARAKRPTAKRRQKIRTIK